MAFSASHGALSSLPQFQVSSEIQSTGSGIVWGGWPCSRTGKTSFPRAQLRAPCNRFVINRYRPGKRKPSHVTSIGVSEEIAVEEHNAGPMKKALAASPFPFEVLRLLTELCDGTSIAELQLKVGSFRLNVKRDAGKLKNANVISPMELPPVPSKPMVDSLPSASAPLPVQPAPSPNSKPKSSAATGLIATLAKPLSSTWALLESAADEGLLFVKSPKVGYFRKGRTVKGKRGPPLLEEGQLIKEGHIVCFLEQLGTQQPVESQISGEVVKVLWDDGEPVGYGDPLIAVRPSFPGIKKLT